MLSILIGLLALQSAQTAAPRYETPTIRAVGCRCPAQVEADAIRLEGLVVDAEVTLAPDGLSINDRMATVFMIKAGGKISGRTKIWHFSNPDQCGVTFDYGARYKLVVRQTEEGDLETDQCLMRQAPAATDSSN